MAVWNISKLLLMTLRRCPAEARALNARRRRDSGSYQNEEFGVSETFWNFKLTHYPKANTSRHRGWNRQSVFTALPRFPPLSRFLRPRRIPHQPHRCRIKFPTPPGGPRNSHTSSTFSLPRTSKSYLNVFQSSAVPIPSVLFRGNPQHHPDALASDRHPHACAPGR